MFPFFILPPEYRAAVFKQIHEIVFHGKGGFDWETVYNMPIWLRKYTFNSINEFYKKEKAEYDEAMGKGKMITENTPIAKPNIPQLNDVTPTYTSKVSRK